MIFLLSLWHLCGLGRPGGTWRFVLSNPSITSRKMMERVEKISPCSDARSALVRLHPFHYRFLKSTLSMEQLLFQLSSCQVFSIFSTVVPWCLLQLLQQKHQTASGWGHLKGWSCQGGLGSMGAAFPQALLPEARCYSKT